MLIRGTEGDGKWSAIRKEVDFGQVKRNQTTKKNERLPIHWYVYVYTQLDGIEMETRLVCVCVCWKEM